MVKQTSENSSSSSSSSSMKVPAEEQWRSGSFSIHGLQKPSRRRMYDVPPKVYTVHPREFRRLVQRLTGAPPPAPPRRQQFKSMAPPPVSVVVDGRQLFQQTWPPPATALQLQEKSSPRLHCVPALPPERKRVAENPVENTFSGFLSPSSHSPWLLLSPGTIASFEYGTAL